MPNCKTTERLRRLTLIRESISKKFISIKYLSNKLVIPLSSIHYILHNNFQSLVEYRSHKGKKFVKLISNEATKIEKDLDRFENIIKHTKELRYSGHSYSEIKKMIKKLYSRSLGDGTLVKHLNNSEISQEGYIKLTEKIKRDRSLAGYMSIKKQIENGRDFSKLLDGYRYDPTINIKEQEEKINVVKSRLIGHCLFDGYVSDDYEAFVISYTSVIEEQVDYFRYLIKEIYGLESSKETQDNKFTSRTSSKNAVIDLLYYTPSYSTKDGTGAIIPSEILNGTEEIKIAFLKAFWNDEGCIVCNRIIDKNGYAHFKRQLEAYTENDNVREGLIKLHKDLGFSFCVFSKKIIINGIDNLKLFKNKIDFEPYAKVTKNYASAWYGVEKQKILSHSINTYEKIPKAYIATYGCYANKADSNSINGLLFKIGFDTTENLDEADLVFVNTCGVKGVTQNKIISFIKSISKSKKILVGGCLTRVIDMNSFTNNNAKIFDTNTINYLAQLIFNEKNKIFSAKKESRLHLINLSLPKKNDVFILPISQGCIDACYYCATKIARGNLKSYEKEELIKKAKEAISKGYKVIHLTSQDNGCYGFDINCNLANLIRDIASLEGNFELRVGMMHPRHIPKILDDLTEVYKDQKVIKFLHIPIQSGSNKVLKEMNRKGTIEEFEYIINKFREEIPGITISTDIIVGYPTETEENFQETVDLVKRLKFEVINISKFASRSGTYASKLKQLSSQIIKQRSVELTRVYKDIRKEINEIKDNKLIILQE